MFDFLNKKEVEDPALLKQIIKDGVDYAAERFSSILMQDYLTTSSLAYGFVMQELDGARQGNDLSIEFVKNSGVAESEYKGSLNQDTPELDIAQEWMQMLTSKLYPRMDIIVPLRLGLVKYVMRRYDIGKGLINEDWMQKIWTWADECEIDEDSLPRTRLNLLELEELIVTGNKIKSLPDGIGNLIYLRGLDVSYNNLKSLPESIRNLNNLEYLGVIGNNLELFPESIEDLRNIKSIYVDENNIESLPESIGRLSSLTNLSISSNNLESLPESLGDLINLRYLDVSGNNLKSLPESIGNLNNLEYLNVSGNNLELLPESIEGLRSIEKIHVDENNLKSLPESIVKQVALKRLEETEERERMERLQSYSDLFNLKP